MSEKKHNPDSLTPEQYGQSEGWRLLDADEVGDQFTNHSDGIEGFDGREWWGDGVYCGNSRRMTYRTKLTRSELREARGLQREVAAKLFDDNATKLFALSTTLERTSGNTTTTRQIMGWRKCTTELESVGSFVKELQRKNVGFNIGEVLVMQIPDPDIAHQSRQLKEIREACEKSKDPEFTRSYGNLSASTILAILDRKEA